MENISLIVIGIATFLNALSTIGSFIRQAKKPVDTIVDNRFKEALEPINAKLDNLGERVKKLDIHQCRSYLVDYLTDVEMGIQKAEIQTKRAYEVYDHYVVDLKGNSYIHDKWEKLMK